MTTAQAMPASTTKRSDRQVAEVMASCVVAIAGYGFYCGLPVILGAIAAARGYEASHIGWIASAEILGLLLGGLLAARWMPLVSWRRLAAAGLLLLTACHLGALAVSDIHAFCALRLVSGLAGGLVYAIGVAGLASTSAPTRNVAIFTAVLTLIVTLELNLVPAVVARAGLPGLFGGLSAFALLGLMCLPFLAHRNAAASTTRPADTTPLLSPPVWLFLIGVSLFHVAPAIFWAYGERIGADIGMPATVIGLTLTAGSVLGALACLCTALPARWWGQRGAMQGLTLLLGAGLISWLVGEVDTPGYVLRSLLIALPWAVAGVYQLNIANEMDPSGRLSALVAPAQTVGLALGPLLGSMLLQSGSAYRGVFVWATAFLALSLVLGAVTQARSRREGRPRVNDG